MVTVPNILTPEYIVDRWPKLFHMAEEGSWPSIQRHGLLSTTALLDLYEISGEERERIESRRRRDSVEVAHHSLGKVVIRDNKPINETVLRRTLVGIDEADWYRTLNGRVFFWLTSERLSRLRNAPPYRERKHDILVVSTESLLSVHADNVELSPMNSGAVHPSADYTRGPMTFRSIATYEWKERVRTAPREPIVELTLPYAVHDISAHVTDVSTE